MDNSTTTECEIAHPTYVHTSVCVCVYVCVCVSALYMVQNVVAAAYPSSYSVWVSSWVSLFGCHPGYLCLGVILGISVWNIKCNTTIRKLAHQQWLSSLLLPRHLHFFRHFSRMPDSQLPEQLLVCVPAQGARSADDQKCRWNDLVEQDLVKCGLEQDWSELAQDRTAWRGVVEMRIDTISKEAKKKEDRKKDGRK